MLLLACAAVLTIQNFGPSAGGEPAKTQANRQFRLTCKIVETDAEGKETRRSTPVLITEDGRPASFQNGSEFAVPTADNKVEFLVSGITVKLVPRGWKTGKVRLDATLETTRVELKSEGQ
jgi:hypothetical protein